MMKIRAFILAISRSLGAFALLCSLPVHGEPVQSLITIGPSITEIAYALDMGNHIIATDHSSQTHDSSVTKLGYYRQLSSEGLISLNPTRIVGTSDMGPPIVLEHLEQAGIPLQILPSSKTLASLQQQITTLATLFNKEAQGNDLWHTINKNINAVTQLAEHSRARVNRPLRVIYMMAYGGTPLIAGENTTAHELIKVIGAENPAKMAFSGYKPVSAEALLMLQPDAIIVGDDTLVAAKDIEGVLRLLPGIQTTPAGQNKAVIAIDDTAIMNGFSPRIGKIALSLAHDLYQ